MKRITKQVKGNIVQLTIADSERWYIKTENKIDIYVPSITWICGHYPKGIAFYKWLANKGWNEAEAIKSAAADKGSKIHQAIVNLIDGQEVLMEAKYPNDDGEVEELSVEEYEAIKSFADWHKEVKPKVLAREEVVFTKDYAGTIDLVCEIDEKLWLIDFKSGQYIWPEHELQLSAYRHAWNTTQKKQISKTAILQLGYQRNKNKYKFTETEDKFKLFCAARDIWQNETAGQEPLKKDLPLRIKL